MVPNLPWRSVLLIVCLPVPSGEPWSTGPAMAGARTFPLRSNADVPVSYPLRVHAGPVIQLSERLARCHICTVRCGSSPCQANEAGTLNGQVRDTATARQDYAPLRHPGNAPSPRGSPGMRTVHTERVDSTHLGRDCAVDGLAAYLQRVRDLLYGPVALVVHLAG